MSLDLIMRYAVIALAAQLAAAWAQAFQAPWPLPGAFELAATAEEQLFRSLGVLLPREPLVRLLRALSLQKSGWVCKFERFCTHPVRVTAPCSALARQNPWSPVAVMPFSVPADR